MNPQDKTRQGLLEAATDVFAEMGYDKASTREICRRAQANVAAIHYHFGDKAELYREVFRAALHELIDRSADFASPGKTLHESLVAYYHGMLEPLMSDQRRNRLLQLHAREQFEPSGILGDIRSQVIASQHNQMTDLLCRQFDIKKPDLEVQRLTFAIVGMSVIYWHASEMVTSFAPQLIQGKDWITPLTVRLADFACALIDSERHRRQNLKRKKK